jgi:hypothetical protein
MNDLIIGVAVGAIGAIFGKVLRMIWEKIK